MIDYGTADGLRWNANRDVAEFTIRVDAESVICRVSMEAIEDHYGEDLKGKAHLEVAELHFDEITDQIGAKIALGAYEDDGTILLRSLDW